MAKKTIKTIKAELDNIDSKEALQSHPDYQDSRKGVQQAFQARYKHIEKVEQLERQYEEMCQFEETILNETPNAIICGIDEVGRGPLAGPVVASAVVLNAQHHYIGINDSKQLSVQKREHLSDQLQNQVKAWNVGIASAQEIDQYNIYEATKLAMYRAIEGLNVSPTHYLIDAMILERIEEEQHSIIKGDARSVSIAAASIIAKVYRDQLMKDYEKMYPGYDFANNAGYGTKKHLEGLKQLGITPIHRQSFEPIKSQYS